MKKPEICAGWLDLARQKETVEYVCRYMDDLAKAGMNTVILYLEDRIKTKSYPYCTDEESYSPDEIRRIVAYGESVGIMCIPSLEALGHCGRFFRHPEMQHMSETREGVSGRYSAAHSTFCPSLPETQAFLRNYITEVLALFPAPYADVDYDESWSIARCSLCKPMGERAAFLKSVMHSYDIVKSCGKRMMMADDMLEHFEGIEYELPKDIILTPWHYVHFDRNPEGHFNTSLRVDILKRYEELGFEVVLLSYESLFSVDCISRYANKGNVKGLSVTTWELTERQNDRNLPIIAYAGAVWAKGKPMGTETMIEATIPFVGSREAAEVLVAIEGVIGEVACEESPLPLPPVKGPFQNLIRRELRADMVCPMFEKQLETTPFTNETVRDIYLSRVLLFHVTHTLRRLGFALHEYLTGEAPLDKAHFFEAMDRCKEKIDKMIAIDTALWKRCRPGIPMPQLSAYHQSMLETVERLCKEARECEPGCIGRMDIHFFLADVTAAPKTKAILHYEDGDELVVHQIMKSRYIRDDAHYDISFRIDPTRKPKAVTLAVTGYGAIGIAHVDVTLPSGRLDPIGITKVTGQVEHPEFLLVDDSRAAMFGEQDMLLTMHRYPTINDGEVSVTLALG